MDRSPQSRRTSSLASSPWPSKHASSSGDTNSVSLPASPSLPASASPSPEDVNSNSMVRRAWSMSVVPSTSAIADAVLPHRTATSSAVRPSASVASVSAPASSSASTAAVFPTCAACSSGVRLWGAPDGCSMLAPAASSVSMAATAASPSRDVTQASRMVSPSEVVWSNGYMGARGDWARATAVKASAEPTAVSMAVHTSSSWCGGTQSHER